MKYLSILLTLIIFSSCNSDDDAMNTNDNAPNGNITTTIPGIYTITTFNVDGEDRSNQYNGFTFTYNAEGGVTAQNDLLSEVGSWTYATVEANAELTENLNLTFNGQEPFTDLNRTWDIDNTISTSIMLSAFNSSGDNTRDFLTFTKQ